MAKGKGPRGNLYKKFLRVYPDNLCGLYRMEDTGSTTAWDLCKQLNVGTWGAVPVSYIPGADGHPAPWFDGSADYLNIYSAGFISDASTTEGSIVAYCKVNAANVWADSTLRKIIHLGVDTNNYISLEKTATANTLGVYYKAGGTSKSVTSTALGNTEEWFSLGLTYSATNDAVHAYVNGLEVGTAASSLGTWSGTLASTLCVIGSASTTAANVWSGWLQNIVIWNAVLTADDMYYVGRDLQ